MTLKKTDTVDRIVDDVVSDPETAEKLKKVLHDEMSKSEGEHMAASPRATYVAETNDDVDDMFENMPV